MSKIISFRCDRQMALPSGPEGDPEKESHRIKVTIKVVSDNNVPISMPLLIGTNEAPGAILYFDNDYDPIPLYQDSFIRINTLNDGEADIYLCSQSTILFTLLARIDEIGQDFRSLDLLFYDISAATSSLPAPNLSLSNNNLAIPPWNSLSYAAIANTPLPNYLYLSGAIVCNDYVRIRDAAMIAVDFEVPYSTVTQTSQNYLSYVLRSPNNTLPSPVIQFTASGQGLVMPDPNKGPALPAPEWQYGDVEAMNTWDISPDLVLAVTVVDGVRGGDTYDLHVYLNGYDANGLYMPPAPIQVYTLTAPDDVRPGQKLLCRIPRKNLLGYRRKNALEWGYMWADCLVTRAALSYASTWTAPWGPIRIDFFPV